MRFAEIQVRILERIRNLLHNGEITERGFARTSGISQPHISKVLKGARTLSTERFDLLLKTLGWSLLDFFQETELRSYLASKGRPRAAYTDLSLHHTVGPGLPWIVNQQCQGRYPVPCCLLSGGASLILLRLGPDPDMQRTLGNCNLAAVKLSRNAPLHAENLYAVDRGAETVIRSVRRGAACLYLVSDENWSNPLAWERVAAVHASGQSTVRGRVIWLGQEPGMLLPGGAEPRYTLPAATSWYVSRT